MKPLQIYRNMMGEPIFKQKENKEGTERKAITQLGSNIVNFEAKP